MVLGRGTGASENFVDTKSAATKLRQAQADVVAGWRSRRLAASQKSSPDSRCR